MVRFTQLILRGGLVLFGVGCFVFTTLAFPAALFPYEHADGQITVRSAEPIPASATRVINAIEEKLSAGPLSIDSRLTLYVTGEGWLQRYFFAISPKAGGLAYAPGLFNHAFLTGADFTKNRLLKGTRELQPPMTLSYFGSHELAHVLMGQRLGVVDHHLLPAWIKEGVPDYIALGAPDYIELDAELGDKPITVPMMHKHGSYPRYRLLVAWFLEQAEWRFERLLNSRLSEQEALAVMRTDIRPLSAAPIPVGLAAGVVWW